MIQPARNALVTPASRSSTSSVHRCSSVDQFMATTRCRNLIRGVMPLESAASCKYAWIDAAEAKSLSCGHGCQRKPKVPSEESERAPGYFQKAQVPPIVSRDSRTMKLLEGD